MIDRLKHSIWGRFLILLSSFIWGPLALLYMAATPLIYGANWVLTGGEDGPIPYAWWLE